MKIRLTQYGDGEWGWEEERIKWAALGDTPFWFSADITRYDSRETALGAAKQYKEKQRRTLLRTVVAKQEEIEL